MINRMNHAYLYVAEAQLPSKRHRMAKLIWIVYSKLDLQRRKWSFLLHTPSRNLSQFTTYCAEEACVLCAHSAIWRHFVFNAIEMRSRSRPGDITACVQFDLNARVGCAFSQYCVLIAFIESPTANAHRRAPPEESSQWSHVSWAMWLIRLRPTTMSRTRRYWIYWYGLSPIVAIACSPFEPQKWKRNKQQQNFYWN